MTLTRIQKSMKKGYIGEYQTNLATAVAAIGSEVTTLVIDIAPDDLTADLTIPSTLTIEWRAGCVLGGAFTLTINGTLSAGEWRLFNTSSVVINQLCKTAWFPETNAGIVQAIESVGSTLNIVQFSDKTYTLTGMDETFSNPVHLLGKDNTIIDAADSWRFEDNLSIENMQFTNAGHGTAGSMITLTPTTGSTIDYYKFLNCKWDTMYSAIRAVSDTTGTITRIEMHGCELRNITRYGWRQETRITSGDISFNTLEDFGELVTYSGFCFLFGDYTIWDYITDISIHHNSFQRISGANNGETHAALMYGNRLSMDHNTVIDILGTGEDHEALYMKAYNSSMNHNTIKDGCGDSSDGAIVFKALVDDAYGNVMIGNIVTGDYAKVRSNSGLIFSNNHIEGTAEAAVRIQGGAAQHRAVVTDNTIISPVGIAIYLLDIKDSVVTGNSIQAVSDGIQLTIGTETYAAENTLIANNVIDTADKNINVDSTCSGVRILDNTLTGGGVYIGSATNANGEIRGNTGYITEQSGVTTSYSTDATLTFPVAFAGTPNRVSVIGTVPGEMLSVFSLNSTLVKFSIRTHSGSSGTTQTIYWEIRFVP